MTQAPPIGRASLVGVVVCTALLLAGCSADPGKDPGSKESSNSSGSGAGVEKIDPKDVIVSQKLAVPGSTEDTVTVGIHSLKVDGKVQVLRLIVTPHFASVSKNKEISLFKALGETGFRPQLIDMDHLKEYSVISDTGIRWESDEVYTTALNGKPISVYAVFAAPEDNTKTFSVRVLDSWPEFTKVPVTK